VNIRFAQTPGPRSRPRRPGEGGITLIECLVYIGVLATLLGVAGTAFHQGLHRSGTLRKNAEDIAAALRAGERWRADIRSATAAPRVETAGGRQTLRIPLATGDVTYLFSGGALWRGSAPATNDHPILARVNSSRMLFENRDGANAWRWELELGTRTDKPHVKPLFSFQAAARAR
jgi:type II secretory pathway pseudopilin PulG